MTSMVTVVVPVPPALVADTVYIVVEVTAVGVPLIAPVEESIFRPAGSDGEIVQEVTAPPLAVGVTVVMATSFVKV